MSTPGRARRFPVRSNRKAPLIGFVALLLLGAAAGAYAEDNVVKVRMTVAEIQAENPAATQKLIGAYSEIPGFPAGGKSVKIYAFRGSDLVCIAPMQGAPAGKLDCWHWNDAPEPIRKLVDAKDAESAEK
jgi:hypothetical protein